MNRGPSVGEKLVVSRGSNLTDFFPIKKTEEHSLLTKEPGVLERKIFYDDLLLFSTEPYPGTSLYIQIIYLYYYGNVTHYL